MRLACAALLGLALLWTPPAPAQGASCDGASSTAAMRACENARLERAESGMNAAYRALEAKLDARGRERLRAAQDAWLAFRAAEARFQAESAAGGTLAPLIATSAQADLTEARRRDLENALRGPR